MRHLQQHLFGIDVVEHLLHKFGVETNFEVFAVVVATDGFYSFVAVVDVFGREFQLLTRYFETYLMGALVGKQRHTFDGVEQQRAAYLQLVGILHRDYRRVVRIFAHDKLAQKLDIAKSKKGILVVVLHFHIQLLIAQDVLDLVERFGRQDDRVVVIGNNIFAGVANQLVRIGGYQRHAFVGKLHQHPRHYGPNLVVAGSKNSFADGLRKDGRFDGEAATFFYCRGFGKLFAIVAAEFVLSTAGSHFDGVGVVVDGEGDGHIRQGF